MNRLSDTLEEFGEEATRRLIRNTIWEKEGQMHLAAKALGVTRSVFRYYLKKLDMLEYPENVQKEIANRFRRPKMNRYWRF